MKMLKRWIALCMTALLALTAVGCHRQGEIAVTVEDVEFTSAYYMCALVFADTEARDIVQESLDEGKSASSINYYKQKIEDTDFSEWVKDTALQSLKMIAAYKILCEENDLEIDDATRLNAEQYASLYWTNYGYSEVFGSNGVSLATYTQYMVDSYYSSLYFEHLYGKDGTNEIAADEVIAKTNENFVLVDMLQVSFSDMEDSEIEEAREQFDGYVTALQSGASFADIYREYNKITDEEEAEETAEEETEEKPAPINEYASVLGSEDTDYSSDYYDDAVSMANGEVKLIEQEDDEGLVLLVKRDLDTDLYYMDQLDLIVRHMMKDEDFTADTEKYAEGLNTVVNSYAVNRFKPKKIRYPN